MIHQESANECIAHAAPLALRKQQQAGILNAAGAQHECLRGDTMLRPALGPQVQGFHSGAAFIGNDLRERRVGEDFHPCRLRMLIAGAEAYVVAVARRAPAQLPENRPYVIPIASIKPPRQVQLLE